jgi:hypothetical protein
MELISVEPLGEGWTVRTETQAEVKHFSSECAAEAAARRLGERLSNVGQAAQIQIRLRDGTIVGRFVCPPVDAQRPWGRRGL